MSEWYILRDDQPVAATQLEWAEWLRDKGQEAKRIARTELGESEVSTVFLGLNHAYDGGPPAIFETMVFGGVLDQEQERYSTTEEARAGHKAMCERVNLIRAAAFAFV